MITDYNDLKNLSYVIHNAADDDKYNDNDCFYLQTAAISVTDNNWGSSERLAVGSTTNAFKANYNGNGHRVIIDISSAENNYPVGVFGVVGGGAKIKNVFSSGSVTHNATQTHTAGCIGLIAGNAEVENCKNECEITHTSTSAFVFGVGGIIGGINASGSTINVKNCCNKNNISAGPLKCGGIIGIHIAGTMTMEKDTNEGVISSNVSGTYYEISGGIIGQLNGTSDVSTVKLSECYNNGAVYGSTKIGGLVGSIQKSCTITKCTNNKPVTCSGNYVGGIVGIFEVPTKILHLEEDTNKISSVVKGNQYVGGIVGAGRKMELSKCVNNANIQNYTSNRGARFGGIVGEFDNECSGSFLDKCFNDGDISTGYTGITEVSLGGLIGYLTHTADVIINLNNCGNEGAIQGSAGNTKNNGGLIGTIYNNSSKKCTLYVRNCYVKTNITGGLYTGGLIGNNGTSSNLIRIYNSYFNGKLYTGSSTCYAIGYLSTTYDSQVTVEYCYVASDWAGGTGTKYFYRAKTAFETPSEKCAYFNKTSGNLYADILEETSRSLIINGETCNKLGTALREWRKNTSYSEWEEDDVPVLKP